MTAAIHEGLHTKAYPPGVEVEYEFGGEVYAGHVRRITFDGVLVDGPTLPSIGSHTTLALIRDGGSAILHLSAIVQTAYPTGFGAHFGKLSSRQRQALDAFVVATSRAALGIEDTDEAMFSYP